MTPKQSKRSCSKNETTAGITLPKPSSGWYCTKPEIVDVLSGYTDQKSSARANAIKEVINNEYVPCTSMTIYRIWNAHKNGEEILDTEWSTAGRPRLVGKKILAAVEETFAQNRSGWSYVRKEICSMIMEEKNKAIQEVGHIPLTVGKAMKLSLQQNCYAELTMWESLALTQTAIAKTNTWVAAEKSIRGSITHLALIVATHFVEINTEDSDVWNHLKQL